jgi:putative ABC transport system permease protein
VFERQKEIGVMRSVGASSGAIAVQFLVEGLLVGLIAWLVGAPLSYLVSQGLIAVLPFGGTYTIAYPLTAPIVGLIGLVALVTIASLLPSLSAARKTVSEILRYQ